MQVEWKTMAFQIMFSANILYWIERRPCENEVGFIGTVLELSGTHFIDYLVLNGMLNGIWDFMVFSGTENTI